MGSVGISPGKRLAHEPYHGDSEKEAEGRERELASDLQLPLPLEERYITDHDRAATYGMRMLLRSL